MLRRGGLCNEHHLAAVLVRVLSATRDSSGELGDRLHPAWMSPGAGGAVLVVTARCQGRGRATPWPGLRPGGAAPRRCHGTGVSVPSWVLGEVEA